MNRKAVIVTGELSGESHAVHLVRALRQFTPLEFSGMGSTALANAGVDVIYDYRNISLTGLSEIIRKAGHIRNAYTVLKEHMLRVSPDLLILVDFGGFNLGLVARLARKLRIPTVYFIPPQVWASRRGRIKRIKSRIDLVLSILPFEEPLYRQYGVPVAYVGHPYLRTVKPLYERDAFFSTVGVDGGAPVIAVMPGSRENEAIRHMPILLKVLGLLDETLKRYTVLLPVADSLNAEFFQPFLEGRANLVPVRGLTHDCIAHSDAAVIASGSATLEAAILGTPAVVLYKMSLLSYLIARMVVKVKYISLPNIIAEKVIFPEFIQSIDVGEIAKTVVSMVHTDKSAIKKELDGVRSRLASAGLDPYLTASEHILRFLEHTYGPLSTTA